MQVKSKIVNQDIIIRFQMRSAGVADPITNYINIKVDISHVKGTSMAKACLVAVDGYDADAFKVVTSASGICEVWIDKSKVISTLPKGEYKMTIETQKTVGAPWNKVKTSKGEEIVFILK